MPHRPLAASRLQISRWWPAALLVLAACGHDRPAADRSATASAPAVAVAKLQQINVFVDMSGGMQGFVAPVAAGATGSGFQQTVTALLSAVNAQRAQEPTPPAYYFFKESTPADARLLVPSTYPAMRETVSGGLKNAARGSELPQMLSEALKLQAKKPGTLSLLISDFIFAPKVKGQTWDVKTFIKDALSEVPPAQLAVSVFANTSDYHGNFYPGNRTGPQKLNGEKIPYYIWVLGDPALVAQADAGLLRQLAGQPQSHYHVAFAPLYAVLDFYEAVGHWMVPTADMPPQVVFTEKPTARQPAEVVVGLDLRPLPPPVAAQATAQTLRLVEAPAQATLTQVQTLAQLKGQAASQPALANYSHFVTLRFVRAPAARTTLHLEMARPEPAWIGTYSLDDPTGDSNIKAKGPKTFHLREVLAGVSEYFADEPSAQRLFSLPVQVETRR